MNKIDANPWESRQPLWQLEGEFRRPYPWEIDMTLCIAAVAYGYEPPHVQRIAICADWQTASPQGSSETTPKLRGLGQNWYCLTAGSMVAIPTIHRMLKTKFSGVKIDEVTLRPTLCEVVEQYKQSLAQEFISTRFAMSLEEFKVTGKERLPPEIHGAAWRQITEMKIGAEFIILGFIEGSPTLCKIEDDGRVTYREQYATIGDGGPLAMTSLLQRRQRESDTIHETLYNLYEAKKYAETLPSVGRKETTLGFIEADGKLHYLRSTNAHVYAELYDAYGPKPIPHKGVEVDLADLFL